VREFLRHGSTSRRAENVFVWRDVFTEVHSKAFQREFGETLAMYGYD
jgi:hypothetical protein